MITTEPGVYAIADDVATDYKNLQTTKQAETAEAINHKKQFLYQMNSDEPVMSSNDSEKDSSEKSESNTIEGTQDTPANLDKQVNCYHERLAKGEKCKILQWDCMIPKLTSVGILKVNSFGLVDPNNPIVKAIVAMDEKYNRENSVRHHIVNTVFDENLARQHGKVLEKLAYTPNEYVMGASAFKEAEANADAYLVLSEEQQNLGPMYDSSEIGEAVHAPDGPLVVSAHNEGALFDPAQAAIDAMTATPNRGYEADLESIVNTEPSADMQYGA